MACDLFDMSTQSIKFIVTYSRVQMFEQGDSSNKQNTINYYAKFDLVVWRRFDTIAVRIDLRTFSKQK